MAPLCCKLMMFLREIKAAPSAAQEAREEH